MGYEPLYHAPRIWLTYARLLGAFLFYTSLVIIISFLYFGGVFNKTIWFNSRLLDNIEIQSSLKA